MCNISGLKIRKFGNMHFNKCVSKMGPGDIHNMMNCGCLKKQTQAYEASLSCAHPKKYYCKFGNLKLFTT